MAQKLIHICEVCGKAVIMTLEQASSRFIKELNRVNVGLLIQRHLKLNVWETLTSQSLVIKVEEESSDPCMTLMLISLMDG